MTPPEWDIKLEIYWQALTVNSIFEYCLFLWWCQNWPGWSMGGRYGVDYIAPKWTLIHSISPAFSRDCVPFYFVFRLSSYEFLLTWAQGERNFSPNFLKSKHWSSLRQRGEVEIVKVHRSEWPKGSIWMYWNIMCLDLVNIWKKGRPPCAQASRNSSEDIRRMTNKMAHNHEKKRAKLNVLKFILVL
jgi:hypothetical protein